MSNQDIIEEQNRTITLLNHKITKYEFIDLTQKSEIVMLNKIVLDLQNKINGNKVSKKLTKKIKL